MKNSDPATVDEETELEKKDICPAYGEICRHSIIPLYQFLKRQGGIGTFYDLGAGMANVILRVFHRAAKEKQDVSGIEICRSRFEAGKTAILALQSASYRLFYSTKDAIELIHHPSGRCLTYRYGNLLSLAREVQSKPCMILLQTWLHTSPSVQQFLLGLRPGTVLCCFQSMAYHFTTDESVWMRCFEKIDATRLDIDTSWRGSWDFHYFRRIESDPSFSEFE